MLVPKEQTTFKPYVPERYSKSKKYTGSDRNINTLPKSSIKDLSRLCKNCHMPYGNHLSIYAAHCPTTYILQ